MKSVQKAVGSNPAGGIQHGDVVKITTPSPVLKDVSNTIIRSKRFLTIKPL